MARMAKVNTRFIVRHDTTENWNKKKGFIPLAGEVIIYDDFKQVEDNGQIKYIQGIKIGTGNGYVQDLLFVNDFDAEEILNHIKNQDIHVTKEEKEFWDNKLNVEDPVKGNETLVFNRK